jgi:hypothetical protein
MRGIHPATRSPFTSKLRWSPTHKFVSNSAHRTPLSRNAFMRGLIEGASGLFDIFGVGATQRGSTTPEDDAREYCALTHASLHFSYLYACRRPFIDGKRLSAAQPRVQPVGRRASSALTRFRNVLSASVSTHCNAASRSRVAHTVTIRASNWSRAGLGTCAWA